MSTKRRASRILLIGWDAADWKFINPLLDSGLMPNLSRIVDGGVIGNLATLKPCLSPILWTSIATGKTADKHGIAGFVEPIPGGSGVRLVTSTSRTTKAIWNILSQNELRSAVINWFASYPAEPISGTCVSNRFFEGFPGHPNQEWESIPESAHPATLLSELSDLRLHPGELGQFDLRRFVPELERVDFIADPRPRQLAEVLAKTVSVHCVATHLLEHSAWDFMAVYYDGLDVAGHHFMPYHPPQMPNVSSSDFRIYSSVMREFYTFHDEMLGRLLELAGEQTTVMLVSDHGFHCDHLRPIQTQGSAEELAAAWHRHYGILAVRGPGIRQDERVYGATLLDITPTILNLFGLPVGRDMHGRPLIQTLNIPPEVIDTIPSWEDVPGDSGQHPKNLQNTMMESKAAVDQLIALGYLPAATAEAKHAVAIVEAESRFNLAIVHSSHGRHREAIEILKKLHAAQPDHQRYSLALAKCLANAGRHRECLVLIEELESGGWRSGEGDMLAAGAMFSAGDNEGALARIAECEKRSPTNPALFGLIAQLHAAQRQWESAATAYRRALEFDDEQPHFHNGAAFVALQTNDYELAAEHSLRAVGLLFFFPQAHFHLGLAFKGMGEKVRAVRSLKIAVAQAPNYAEAHNELAALKEELGQTRD